MKLVFLTMVLLLGASSVLAMERYTEVWNPPEAQGAQAAKSKTRSHATQIATKKKRKASTSVKQVADKASAEASGVAPRAKSAMPKPSEPVIPRKIEPNGQVMRV